MPDTEDENLRDGSYRKPKPGQTYQEWMLFVTTKVRSREYDSCGRNESSRGVKRRVSQSPPLTRSLRTPPQEVAENVCELTLVQYTNFKGTLPLTFLNMKLSSGCPRRVSATTVYEANMDCRPARWP